MLGAALSPDRNALDTDVFRNTKPATALLVVAVAGLFAHAAYALVSAQAGLDRHFSSWAFYGLALLVLAAGVARAGLVPDERRAWTAAAAAFAAWFLGSVFYATGGGAEHGRLFGAQPADEIVVAAVRVGVGEGELGLADATQPADRLPRLGDGAAAGGGQHPRPSEHQYAVLGRRPAT